MPPHTRLAALLLLAFLAWTLQIGKVGRLVKTCVDPAESHTSKASGRPTMYGVAPSIPRYAGPACNKVSQREISLRPKNAVKLQPVKFMTARHIKSARWISAAAAVESDVGDHDEAGADRFGLSDYYSEIANHVSLSCAVRINPRIPV